MSDCISTVSEWWNIHRAASYLGVSTSFLRKMVRQRRIHYARPGGKVLRFRKSDLDHWLESSDTPRRETGTREQPNELDFARKLLQVLGWPAIESNLVLVAEAIIVEAKKREGSRARAFDYLLQCVLANQAEGVPIKETYFRELGAQHIEGRSCWNTERP